MATSVSLIQALASGLVTSAGVGVASGKVRFYSPGTLTAIPVFSDTAGVTAITQPITLSAGGTATVYGRGLVRMIVKDATDVTTLLDVNINSTVLNGVSVDDYGAVGDATTDCTSAFTAAVAAAAASPATARVFVPAGTFRITSAIVLASNIEIIGSGRSITVIQQASTSANAFTASGGGARTLRQLDVNAATASSGSVLATSSGMTITLDEVSSNGTFARIISGSGNFLTVLACSFNSSVVALEMTASGRTTVVGSIVSSSGTAITNSVGDVLVSGSAIASISMTSGNLYMSGADLGFGTLTIANAAIAIHAEGSNLGSVVLDSRVGTPCVFTLAGTNSVTPLPNSSPITKMVQSGAAAVTTINAPTGTFPFGFTHQITYVNTSGGALTWTHNAVFKISAAVAPATGNRITVVFYYDPQNATWSEVTRSAAVPN